MVLYSTKTLYSAQVSQDTMMKCNFSYIEQGEPVTLQELGTTDGCSNEDYNSYLETCIASVLKVSQIIWMLTEASV